jgi:hypothetical protein
MDFGSQLDEAIAGTNAGERCSFALVLVLAKV